jgi:hypothetical protein
MKNYFCDIHKLNINIFKPEEETQFIDDNKKEVVIFYNIEGKKYLKKFIFGECDSSCSTVQELLKE